MREDMRYPSRKGYDFGTVTERIVGACIEVHQRLGPGFCEIICQRALALELQAAGLEFSREERVEILYRGKSIGKHRVDFIIEDVMLEVKAKSELAPEDFVRALSYLRASGYRVGLLVNFGTPKIGIKRLVQD
jgi:GxxExxY protein